MPEVSEPRSSLLEALAAALAEGTFVKLVLSKPARVAQGQPPNPERATIRRVDLRSGPVLSATFREGTRDRITNWPLAQAVDAVGAELGRRFHNAHLFTTEANIELRTNKKLVPSLYRNKPTFDEAPAKSHDRVKAYVLDPSAPWLAALGIVSESGHVKSDKADKYKQLQHLVKILDQAADKAGLRDRPSLRVVDIGCGKSYLTFAVWDWCTNHLHIPCEVIGVDRNAELVATCNDVARRLGCAGLRFEASDAGDWDAGTADILIALHACDTATDVALHRGVVSGASLVLAVPCCQKELRPQFRAPPEERALFKHDTFVDRFSQMLTDSLRGLLMESRGYQTRVVEFISDAHTHRNVMILASRTPERIDVDAKRSEIAALKARYHIGHHHLESLLDQSGSTSE
ncbi:MAG: SAM-dependent methyltransferase [Myxococcota bacterium]